MAGVKGRSGRRPQSTRAAFNAFADAYDPKLNASRFQAWLMALHESAMAGDSGAQRFLLEQAMGKALQAIETKDVSDPPALTAVKDLQQQLGERLRRVK